MSSQSEEFQDEGASRPIPSFDASSIKLTTIAPALGVADDNTPDYLQIEGSTKGRGLMTTMFANTGLSYLLGTFGGGIYGLNEGLKNTPSNRFKVKVNSVLNHCSRHGSRIGNVAGVLSIFYSVYEHAADTVSLKVDVHFSGFENFRKYILWVLLLCKLLLLPKLTLNDTS